MKKILLVSILLLLISKLFSQSLSCGYCDKALVKGQPFYYINRCSTFEFDHRYGVIKFSRINKFVEVCEYLGFFTKFCIPLSESKEYVNLIEAYDYTWKRNLDLKRNGDRLQELQNYCCTREHAYNLIKLEDNKAKFECNENLEDRQEIKLTPEQSKNNIQTNNEIDNKEKLVYCINKYRKSHGFYNLLKGFEGGSNAKWYFFEYVDELVNGRKVMYLYYLDNIVKKRFRDDFTEVPGQNNIGVWGCIEDGSGFFIVWQDRSVSIFKN